VGAGETRPPSPMKEVLSMNEKLSKRLNRSEYGQSIPLREEKITNYPIDRLRLGRKK